jgi:diguanylate cyclase (GGDEF)-like protein
VVRFAASRSSGWIVLSQVVEDQLSEAIARLEFHSSHDSLTGLANRRAFDEALAREYRRMRRDDRPLAPIMLDVDRFKAFNDLYGHPAGDGCLRRVAEAIERSVRRPGNVVARYGGEEFAVVLPDTDEMGAMAVAANILRAVRDLAVEHGGSEWEIATLSAGVAAVRLAPSDDAPDALLRQADRALYVAKAGGSNTVALGSLTRAKETVASSVAATDTARGQFSPVEELASRRTCHSTEMVALEVSRLRVCLNLGCDLLTSHALLTACIHKQMTRTGLADIRQPRA